MYNYIRMKLCRHVTTSVCVRVHIMYLCMYVFIYVCMYDCTCVCTLLCTYLCVYMYVFMYIMHIYVCVFTGAALPMGRGAMYPHFWQSWGVQGCI